MSKYQLKFIFITLLIVCVITGLLFIWLNWYSQTNQFTFSIPIGDEDNNIGLLDEPGEKPLFAYDDNFVYAYNPTTQKINYYTHQGNFDKHIDAYFGDTSYITGMGIIQNSIVVNTVSVDLQNLSLTLENFVNKWYIYSNGEWKELNGADVSPSFAYNSIYSIDDKLYVSGNPGKLLRLNSDNQFEEYKEMEGYNRLGTTSNSSRNTSSRGDIYTFNYEANGVRFQHEFEYTGELSLSCDQVIAITEDKLICENKVPISQRMYDFVLGDIKEITKDGKVTLLYDNIIDLKVDGDDFFVAYFSSDNKITVEKKQLD